MLKTPIERSLFLILVITYLIAAILIGGFHHPDEQYQIIHWASFKLGEVNISEMPWEYPTQIRSTLQPAICYLVFQGARAIGISDPFNLALVLRLLSAVYGLFALTLAIKNIRYISHNKINSSSLLLLYLLWFLPYILVRFSSESWSGTTFLICIIVASRPSKKLWSQFIGLGALFGLTFVLRFQCIFMVLGLVAWLLIVKKAWWKSIAMMAIGGLSVLLISISIDRWMYGNWTFSAFNYFKANIINDIASRYGVSPWHQVLQYVLFDTGLPFGLLILIAVLTLLFKERQSPILWSSFPMIIIHTIIPHKELRFLFPLAILVPILLASAYTYWKNLPKLRNIITIPFIVLITINTLALATIISRSTRNGENDIQKVIYQRYSNQRINLLTSASSNPYDPYMKYSYNFYKKANVHIDEITSIWTPDFIKHIKPDMVNLLILSNSEITGSRTIGRLDTLGIKTIRIHSLPHFHQLELLYDQERFERELNLFYLKRK